MHGNKDIIFPYVYPETPIYLSCDALVNKRSGKINRVPSRVLNTVDINIITTI